MAEKFKFIDLFAGIGGFHYGLAQCGGSCVLACEIDEITKLSYFKNFGIIPHNDIRELAPEQIPKYDLLCAGFPCQSFSNIGNKEGFSDPRGNLVFEVIRILNETKPKAFLLENVKGVLSNNKGETFRVLIKQLEKIGYSVHHKILEAKDYGLPQIRKRLFIVGIRNDISVDFVFPAPIGCDLKLSDILGGNTEREFAYTIRVGGRHSGINNKFNWDSYRVNGIPRYITIKECLQLQGFPKNHCLEGSKSAQFKQVGNAVPTCVIEAIGRQLCDSGVFDKKRL